MLRLIAGTVSGFVSDRCTTLSAALAYYTIFALPPLLYLLLTVLTLGLSLNYESHDAERKAQGILEIQAAQMLGNQSATEEISTILDANREAGGKWWKTLLSFGGIIIGATGVVAAIQDSLNRVWSVKPDPETAGIFDFLGKRLLSLGMILGLGFLLLVSLIVSTALTALGNQLGNWIGMSDTIARTSNFIVQGLVTWIMFASIFKFMPDAEVRWKDVLMGARMTTLLFLAGRVGLQWYLALSEPGAQLSSAAASLAVILVWVYYSSMIFLFGAEATKVYATEYGDGIQPVEKAVRFVEQVRRA